MSQQITRKGFLKGALAGAAGIAAASMLGGCSTESPKTADSESIETLESADHSDHRRRYGRFYRRDSRNGAGKQKCFDYR